MDSLQKLFLVSPNHQLLLLLLTFPQNSSLLLVSAVSSIQHFLLSSSVHVFLSLPWFSELTEGVFEKTAFLLTEKERK